MRGQYAEQAARLGAALKKLVANEEAIDNFETYIEWHLPAWYEKYANTPEGLISELEQFAGMFDNPDDDM